MTKTYQAASARRTFAIALLGAVLALGACRGGMLDTRAASVRVPEGGVTLPVNFVGTEIVVFTTINGEGPFPLLLDTGSEVGTLTPEAALRAKVRPRGTVGTRDAHGVRKTEAHGDVDISAFGFVAKGLPFTIDTLPQSILDKHGIVGILGYNAFARSTLVLDYPSRAVHVTNERADASSPDALPLTKRYGDLPFASVGFAMGDPDIRFPWKMLLDTGSDLPMTLGSLSSPLYADTENARPLFASMSSSGSIRAVSMARLELDPMLGRTRVERVTAQIESEYDKGVDSIGHPLLSRFKVTIDPVTGVAVFEHPDEAATIAMPTWRGHGFTGEYVAGAGYRVTSVNPGSPAERGGLLAGDTITAIDAISMIDEPERWPGLTDDPAITHRVFIVDRAGEPHTLTLEIDDILPEPRRAR